MTSDERPLLRVIRGRTDDQASYLEAIALSFDVIEDSHRTLLERLDHVMRGRPHHASGRTLAPGQVAGLMSSAWQMVDALNRLRVLISRTPGLANTPARRLIERALAPVEALRHYIQHLDTEIGQSRGPKREVTWGSLSWVAVDASDADPPLRIYAVTSANFSREFSVPLVNPAGRLVTPGIDLVTLSASTHHVCLSELHSVVNSFKAALVGAAPRELLPHLTPNSMLATLDVIPGSPDAPASPNIASGA